MVTWLLCLICPSLVLGVGREVPSRGPYRTARVPAERGEVGGVHGRTQTTRFAPQREKKNKRHRHFLDTDLPRATRQPRQPRRHMSAPPTHATQPQRQPLPAPAVGALPAASERSRRRLSERTTRCGSVRKCAGAVCRFGHSMGRATAGVCINHTCSKRATWHGALLLSALRRAPPPRLATAAPRRRRAGWPPRHAARNPCQSGRPQVGALIAPPLLPHHTSAARGRALHRRAGLVSRCFAPACARPCARGAVTPLTRRSAHASSGGACCTHAAPRRHSDDTWPPPTPAMAAVPPGVRAVCAQPRHAAPRRAARAVRARRLYALWRCCAVLRRARCAALPRGHAAAAIAPRRCRARTAAPLPGRTCTTLCRPVPRYARTAQEPGAP